MDAVSQMALLFHFGQFMLSLQCITFLGQISAMRLHILKSPCLQKNTRINCTDEALYSLVGNVGSSKVKLKIKSKYILGSPLLV